MPKKKTHKFEVVLDEKGKPWFGGSGLEAVMEWLAAMKNLDRIGKQIKTTKKKARK